MLAWLSVRKSRCIMVTMKVIYSTNTWSMFEFRLIKEIRFTIPAEACRFAIPVHGAYRRSSGCPQLRKGFRSVVESIKIHAKSKKNQWKSMPNQRTSQRMFMPNQKKTMRTLAKSNTKSRKIHATSKNNPWNQIKKSMRIHAKSKKNRWKSMHSQK